MKTFEMLIRGVVGTGALAFSVAAHGFTLNLMTDAPSPQQIGDPVAIIADVPDAGPKSQIMYQFEVAKPPGDFRLLQDFRNKVDTTWVTLDEGPYVLRAIAVDKTTGETQVATSVFARTARATVEPIISATAHPLVGIFSATPCPKGANAIRVRYYPLPSGVPVKYTPYKLCDGPQTVNFYIAGVVAERTYELVGEVLVNDQTFDAAPVQWNVPPNNLLDEFSILQGAGPESSLLQSVLVGQALRRRADDTFFFATNLVGEVIWSYGQDQDDVERATITRPVRGGTFLTIGTEPGGIISQLLREIDLAGHLVRETNREAINDDLKAMGQDIMGGFHHEALRLPNGHTLVLVSVERILTGVQEPGPVNVYGEMVLDLDEDFNVVWSWNSFDHLDPGDVAILNESCVIGGGGCPYLWLGEPAKDWLHMNAIGYSPDDGNFILSARHQDAVYKVDYRNGEGLGDVIWTLGANGDFQLLNSAAPIMPWFSHQHDPRYFGNEIVIYDNGNTRRERLGDWVESRGQVYRLDEVNMIAELILSVDLGHYSAAVGSAQKLQNGNYHFHSGFIGGFANPSFESLEYDINHQTQFIETGPLLAYRAFRMKSLYEE